MRPWLPSLGIVLGVVLAASGALPGCGSSIKIKPTDDQTWFKREGRSALDTDEPSERTREFLRREALLAAWERDPEPTIESLHARLLEKRERIVALHVAELCFRESKQQSGEDEHELKWLLSCAEHAWATLFDPQLEPAIDGYDPGFRLACDLYNRSLARIVKYAAVHRPAREGKWRWSVVGGWTDVALEHSDFAWDPRDYESMTVAYDLEVEGLPHSARSYGIGVPAIVTRAELSGDEGETAGAGDASAPLGAGLIKAIYGATIVMRFGGSILDRTGATDRAARCEIYDPLETASVEVEQRTVPLEADLSTTLAFTLTQADDVSGLGAMFSPEKYQKTTRLLLLEPFHRDKIPVVFVHGLMSSPMTWMPLLNDLLADPEIRRRCQFWFFRYPTGNPILYSASLLRSALRANVRRFDPDGTNPAMNDMVLVGHSMGGLLSRTQVLTTGDRLWSLLSDVPFDEFAADVGFDAQETALYRDAVFFERQPYVGRVVFMAVPLRGAELAQNVFVKMGTKLIELPQAVAGALTSITQKGANLLRKSPERDLAAEVASATGVGGLAPDNVVQKELAQWPFPEGLPIHTLIGNEEGTEPGGSDGVVDYASSHVDGVVSEKVIQSGHNVQASPEAAVELRRILHLHLQEFDARAKAAATPPGEKR